MAEATKGELIGGTMALVAMAVAAASQWDTPTTIGRLLFWWLVFIMVRSTARVIADRVDEKGEG